MMTEYEYIFAISLQQKLKRRIKGNIYVTVIRDDKLYVKIKKDSDFIFETTIDRFTDKLQNGFTSDYAAYDILKQYKQFVYERIEEEYFY